MLDFITNEIKKKLITEKRKYISPTILYGNCILLLYLRYICNKNKINDFQNKKLLLENISEEKQNVYENFFEKNINDLLIYLQKSDIVELTNDFINKFDYNTFSDIDNIFINNQDKTIYYFNISEKNNKLVYYSIDYEIKILLYEMLDEINNTTRKIVTNLKDINLNDVDNLVIVDEEPAYRYLQDESIIEKVNDIFLEHKDFKGNIILKTSYSKVSILKNRQLINYLVTVCIYEKEQDTILIFKRENNSDTSTIVMIKDNNYENIKEIIGECEENKEYLLRVPKNVIISNNYRIGFNMYLPNRTEEVKSINDIIDENTKITENISRLNKLIQQEMDKLISK